jgi:hypothetical protein
MSDLQFEEETFRSRIILGEPTSPKMIKILLKIGVAKDEKQAGRLLICFSAVCFIFSMYIIYNFLFTSENPKFTSEGQQTQELVNIIMNGESTLPTNQ